MSKKLAGGAGAILLDVKTGSGAFMKDPERARELAELCVALAGHMAALAGVAEDAAAGTERARAALASGDGLERFRRFVEAQGGDPRITDDPGLLPQAPVSHEVRAEGAGVLAAVDAEAIGRAAASVGAGRQRKEDSIDLAVGVDFLVAIGDAADGDTVVARVLANDEDAAAAAGRHVLAALTWSDEPVAPPELICAVVG